MEHTGNRFRRLPSPLAGAATAVVAALLGLGAGVAGAYAAIYLYDRGNSKGNDLVIGISGLFGVGTFAFVIAFSWLSKVHHNITWRTPIFALAFCFTFPAITTMLLWDSYYSGLILGGWLAILLCGLLALAVASRFVTEMG